MSAPLALDEFDHRLLELLQRDADATLSALGEAVGLSASAVQRRIKRYRESGLMRQVALGRTSGLSGGLQLRAEDLDQRWLLPATGAEASDAVLEAEASVLLLFLWRRTDLDDPRIRFSGPRATHDELQEARLAP